MYEQRFINKKKKGLRKVFGMNFDIFTTQPPLLYIQVRATLIEKMLVDAFIY